MSSVPSIPPDRALRVIVSYKLVRGGASLLGGLVLATLVLRGGDPLLKELARILRDHFTSGVSGELASSLQRALDVRHAWLAVIGLTLDGAVTLLEGFALQRGQRWGYWLVVGVAAVFVPFELAAWLHQPTFGRALLLVANVLVALYLARRVLREQAAKIVTRPG